MSALRTKSAKSAARIPARASLLLAFSFACALAGAQPTKRDSGWVPLWNGKDWEGFYYYIGSQGMGDVKTQTNFTGSAEGIRAMGSYALLSTVKEYTHYRVRVEYRWLPNASGGANAGLMVLMDNVGAKTARSLRPRSIEVNARRDNNYPWTLWAGTGVGPYITTTVEPNSQRFRPAEMGGVPWTCDPWNGDQRIVLARSDFPNPERTPGQWNLGEARILGDSGEFYLNGVLRTRGWKFQVRGSPNDADPLKRVKVASGGIAIQSEGSEILYRNWEVQELDPVTRQPLHATRGCTNPASPRFNPKAVIEDGTCAATAVRREARGTAGKAVLKRVGKGLWSLDGRKALPKANP